MDRLTRKDQTAPTIPADHLRLLAAPLPLFNHRHRTTFLPVLPQTVPIAVSDRPEEALLPDLPVNPPVHHHLVQTSSPPLLPASILLLPV
jgi:hypothetical protein